VCGERIKGYTQSLWYHLEAKHKRTWQKLKGLLDKGAPLDGGIVSAIGSGSQQKTIIAPKFTLARKEECDMACARRGL
jgi:hypothetical protein